MPRTRLTVAATGLAVAATTLALAAPASAAPALAPLFQASAAGTAASLLGGTVTSSPTAATGIRTRATTSSNALSVTGAGVTGLLTAGAVDTESSTTPNAAGTVTTVTAHARTGAINLLGGVLTADAVDTTSTLSVRSNKVIATAGTRFANLRITGGTVVRGEVAPNTTVEVPGIARIVLNASGTVQGSTDGMAVATGIVITLLDDTYAGSTIVINPTSAQTARVGAAYAPLSGVALGAQVTVAGDASASVGPLGALGMPDIGTNNQTLTNSPATADLGLLGTTGALTSSANGVVSNGASRSTMISRVADVNLLGGIITADAMTSKAEARVRTGNAPITTASVSFTNLQVLGIPVPLDAAPGLVIPLPGIGGVAIRATATTDTAAAAAALTITLSTAAFGLPAGATIQIGFAYAGLLSV